jgi:hypothetical protein
LHKLLVLVQVAHLLSLDGVDERGVVRVCNGRPSLQCNIWNLDLSAICRTVTLDEALTSAIESYNKVIFG